VILLNVATKKLFTAMPLSLVTSRWDGYFVDRAGVVYSNKKTDAVDHVRVMKGTRPYGTSHRNYTLNRVSVQGPYLLSQAKKVSTWMKQTAPYTDVSTPAEVAALPEEAKPQWPFPTDKAKSDAYLGKKQDVLQAVKDRGFVIASIVDNKLVFGSEPKIHSSVVSANEELARLANTSVGTVFVRLDINAAVVAGGLTHL
jgi:hypothetical protein